jgi:FkbM family methyltransferase
LSVSSKSTGSTLLDWCGPWIDAAQKALRPFVPKAVYHRLAALYNLALGTHKVGRETYLRMQRLSSAAANDLAVESFSLPMLQHPIWLRPGTPADVGEVVHTVIRANYGRQLPTEPVRLIIDAGAYIGDTTVWYLSRFPEATVIALEPNPRSFALLERNCRDYGSRAILLQAAIWPSRARLEVNGGSDGTTDSSVRLAAGTQGNSCDGVTIGDLLDRFGSAHNSMVDIFKCDIEGAEADLFSGPDDGWIRRVRTMYVDVHNAQARRIVAEIARRNGFVMHNWRELVILHR